MSEKLTQAVFVGLPPGYQWAAVDADGDAFAFDRNPPFIRADVWLAGVGYHCLGSGYDATDWQNSLIERTESEENQALAEAQAEIQVLKKCFELVTAQRDALLEDNAHFCELLKKQRWISVADELPTQDGAYLVYEGFKESIMRYFSVSEGRFLCKHVTHWQHRPAPPEGV